LHAHRSASADVSVTTVASYVAKQLALSGTRFVFVVTGGGAMAAEAYARIAEQPPILNVTTGPGGINALSGVFGAWTDSVPMIVVSESPLPRPEHTT